MRARVLVYLATAAVLFAHSSSVVASTALTCPFNIQTTAGSTLASDVDTTKTKKNTNGGSTGGSGSDSDMEEIGTGDASGSTAGSAGEVRTQIPSTASPVTVAPQHASPGTNSSVITPETKSPDVSPGTNSTPNAGGVPAPTTVKPIDAGRRLEEDTTTAPPTATLATNTSTVATTTGSGSNTGGADNSSALHFTCDEVFYQQWNTNGLACGVDVFDVAKAVAASRCVIYSGTLGMIPGTACISICAFPACEGGLWTYGGTNGIASSVYQNTSIASFVPTSLKTDLAKRNIGAAALVSNTTLVSKQQCEYASEASFASCACSKLVNNGTKSDDLIKKERQYEKSLGIVPTDKTTNAGSVLAPATQSVAGVTVFMSGVAAVATSVVGGASATGSSMAAAGTGAAVVTIEICQFAVLLNQLQLEGKSSAMALFGKQMAPSTFTFLPFGKLEDSEPHQIGRRLASDIPQATGIAQYSRTLGIREDMLFVVTLAGVVVVMASVMALFGIVYVVAGLFMDREVFMNKFFDKMIGLQVLIAILSQYTIGVTATYQIYYSFHIENNPTDAKCILAIVALLTLAIGIVVYGYLIIHKHEDEIRDVGTFTHVNKKVCLRYGPLYDEYKFKHRFFFAPKMMLALVSGVATGYVGIQPKYQVSIILAVHVFFFFYLEVKSPHHSRFVQTTTSFVMIMKIATLALTFFLISATTSSALPSELQSVISLAIVGLNLFVLFLLMVRSLYAFWKKYQLQKDANYEDVDQSAAQEYFKEETPPRRDDSHQHRAYLHAGNASDVSEMDEIRLQSHTHMQHQPPQRGGDRSNRYDVPHASRYDAARSNGAQPYIGKQHGQHQQRNDVVEL